jgi:hypothetical protein
VADHVLLVCTELYRKKVRQKVAAYDGLGVCWEANLIYNQLYIAKLNTTKFVPLLFSRSDEKFIPGPLQGAAYRFRFGFEGRLLATLRVPDWTASSDLSSAGKRTVTD